MLEPHNKSDTCHKFVILFDFIVTLWLSVTQNPLSSTPELVPLRLISFTVILLESFIRITPKLRIYNTSIVPQ